MNQQFGRIARISAVILGYVSVASFVQPAMGTGLTSADYRALASRGITKDAADRQVAALLRRGGSTAKLDRPCTRNDGIEPRPSTARARSLAERFRRAAARGEITLWVPASGAASRMYAADDHQAAQVTAQLQRFPFHPRLVKMACDRGGDLDKLVRQGSHGRILDLIRSPEGLGLANQPKGLAPFHRYRRQVRTAFAEQLRDAVACFKDDAGKVRAHFTVSPEHQRGFAAELVKVRRMFPGVRFDVSFSQQDPATDVIAWDEATDGPVRDLNGQLVFRPGGHGALVDNLETYGGQVALVRNIDNVQRKGQEGPALRSIAHLGGRLVELQRGAHQHLRALERKQKGAVSDAERFLEEQLPGSYGVYRTMRAAAGKRPDTRQLLLKVLHRPYRVCGMVPNAGEPGGGPVWLADGSLQIVETAEIAKDDNGQMDILRGGTYFNPTFMFVGLTDHHGRRYHLPDFVDRRRVILGRKPVDGKWVRTFEHPGVWNGGMGHWNTVFAEMDPQAFTPVKTLFDWLRPEHQP